MALVGRRDGRNFGYGRQLSYAGPQALKDMFGGGHYCTVKAHYDRWQAFVKWCRSEQGPGINDARQIDRKVLADYAAYLRDVVMRLISEGKFHSGSKELGGLIQRSYQTAFKLHKNSARFK